MPLTPPPATPGKPKYISDPLSRTTFAHENVPFKSRVRFIQVTYSPGYDFF